MSVTPNKRREDVEQLDTTPRKRQQLISAISTPNTDHRQRVRQRLYRESNNSPASSSISISNTSSVCSEFVDRDLESLIGDVEGLSVHSSNFSQAGQSSDSDDDDPTLSNIHRKKLKLKGADYLLFKPKRKTSLYATIMNNSDNIEEIVDTWIISYQQTPDTVATLIQLIIDVLGHQDFVVLNYYKGNATDYIEMKNTLEKRHPKSHYKSKCILSSQSKFATSFADVLFAFLHQLLHACHKHGILYSMHFMGVFMFLKYLADTKFRMIKLTAVIIVTKFITTILFIGREHQKKMDDQDSDSNSQITRQQAQQNMDRIESLSSFIEHFQYIFYKNCDLNDVKLHHMRYLCVTEMRRWYKHSPEKFITPRMMSVLGHLVIDENSKVRVAALETCIGLMTEKCIQHARNHTKSLNKLCLVIGCAVRDYDNEVRACAIRFFTSCRTFYPNAITDELRNDIIERMYAKNLSVAKECGLFFRASLEGLEASAEALKTIISLKFVDKFQDKLSLVVEDLIYCAPELDLSLLVAILVRNAETGFDYQEEVVIIEMIHHLVHILIKGTTEFNRKGKRMTVLDPVKSNADIAAELFPHMEHILTNYANEEICLKWIIKTLLLIDYQDVSFAKHQQQLWQTLNCLGRILQRNPSEDIQGLISKFFKMLVEGQTVLQTRATALLDSFIEQIVATFTDNYCKYQEDVISAKSNEMCKLRNDFRLIAVLFEDHNLTTFLKWNLLFSASEEHINKEVLKYQMISARWFLHWNIKNLMSAQIVGDHFDAETNSLKQKIVSYLDTCLGVLKRSKNFAIESTAYLCICNTFVDVSDFENYFKTTKKQNLFEELLSNSLNCSKYLTEFMIFVCFTDTTVSRDDKRMYLMKFLKLILECQLSMRDMCNVLEQYGSHTEIYKDIFETVFANVDHRSKEAITTVVLKTLTTLFEKRRRDDMKAPMQLSSALADIFPKERLALLMRMGLHYVVQSNARFEFVILMKAFAKRMTMIDRAETLSYMKEIFETADLRHVSIDKLIVCLKTRNVRGMLGRTFRSGLSLNMTDSIHSDTEEDVIDDNFSDEGSSSIL